MSDTSKMDHLYDQITAAVDQSISTVSEKAFAAHGNQDLEGAINSSRTLLERFRERTNGDIQKLKEIADWSTFTIAFYGETNAGKSTLIETLRIMLGDNDKLAMQAQYQALAKDLRIEPPRNSRRPVGLSQADMACCSRVR
ncbi:hypothetical protein LJR039_003984 [Pseudorhodoferax sp. LjRoot39]|uniref:hypothetical protein n=1 Tax=Pseudorhodoferax sp. LjRoot39 TaxID=3342328 RepID=UPI003ECD546F